MGFAKLNCPNCGANIELSDDREFGFCSFCGTKVVQDKLVIEHKGSVSINGIATEKALLERAYIFLEDGNFDDADNYLERVLDINPHSSKAYIGKLLFQLRLKNIDDLGLSIKILKYYNHFNKALRFADESEQRILNEYLRQSINNYNNEIEKQKSEVERLKKKIQKDEKMLFEREKNITHDKRRRIPRVLFLIFSSLLFSFFSAGIIADDKSDKGFYYFIVVSFLISLGLFVFSLFLVYKARKRSYLFEKEKTNYKAACYYVERRIKEINNWIKKMELVE